ncbi:MAG: ABC transporter substrate-binding protein [Clostridia bacterium]|nr:ABC transporter substrate-binding protein [Clostridia bacterium]
MKFTKIIALLLAVMTVMALAACGTTKPSDDTAKTPDTANAGDKTYKVGVCQLVQHPALDAATKGFVTALKDKLGDKVEIDEQNASGESATCATIVNQFVSNSYDLIMANATPALQSAVSATDTIPIVATSITDYASALGIDNWTGKTGMNVTGTSDLAPLDQQAKMFTELLPDVKTVGIVYCSSEANSKYQADVVEAELGKLGFAVKIYTFADSNDIASVVTNACSECDALYVPTDNKLAEAAEIVDGVTSPAGIPVIAGEAGICKGCGIATLSIDYYSIGYAAGVQAYDILVNGKDAGDIEIGFASDLTKQYSPERCTALNITVPEGYEPLGD